MALAALLFWLTLAQVQDLQDPSAFALLLGLLALAAVAYGYATRRFDPGMLSLGALYALAWVIMQYALYVDDAFEVVPILGLILALLAIVTKTLAWFRRLHTRHSRTTADTDAWSAPNADHVAPSGVWTVSLFRSVALWLIAWLLVAFLFLLLDLSQNTMGVLGLLMTGAGAWKLNTLRDPTWREIVVAVIAAGFILVSHSGRLLEA